VIDLHTHSTASDGSDSPTRVVELAVEAGCGAVALTDHDRLDGVAEARAAAGGTGTEVVAGCELSCDHPGTMHLLVYFLEPGLGPLQDELVARQQSRDRRNQQMVARLSELGLPVSWEEIEREAGGRGVGRPHVAAVMMRKGIVSSVQEAFDVWLAKGRPAYLPKDNLAPAEAVRLARASGAVAVLAHPLSLGLDPGGLEATAGELRDIGLGGLEAVYGRYYPAERAGLIQLADRLGLVVTGGSDYHGRYKPDLAVGTGRGDLDVPDEALERIRALAGGA
jgi:predicted metal-dependent phosphoesterase TrpH